MLKLAFLATSLTIVGLGSSVAFAAQGAYFSAGVGHAIFEEMPSSGSYGYYNTDIETSSTAVRAALGYTKDMNTDFGLGVEVGYNNYGSETYNGYTSWNYQSSLEYKYSSVDLLAKLAWHVSKAFDIYGKLGIANEMVKVSGDTSVDDNSKVLPEIGIGISYFATDKLALDLAVYRTQGSDVEFNDVNSLPSIMTALVGVSYYFG